MSAPAERAESAARAKAAEMAGRLDALISLLRSNNVPGEATIALCERTVNEWDDAARAAHAARLDEITRRDAAAS